LQLLGCSHITHLYTEHARATADNIIIIIIIIINNILINREVEKMWQRGKFTVEPNCKTETETK